jgi:hypothetical protein
MLRLAAVLTQRKRSRDGDRTFQLKPDPADRNDDRRFMVVAETRAVDGSIGRAMASGASFHAVSAALLAHGAVTLAQGPSVAGVHSAATAFAPETLLDALDADGVRWSAC